MIQRIYRKIWIIYRFEKNDWCMEFNVENCTVVHIGESNTRKRCHLERNELMAVTTCRERFRCYLLRIIWLVSAR